MRVNQTGTNPTQNREVSGAKKSDRAASTKRADRTDKSGSVDSSADVSMNISTRAKEAAKAKEIAASTPDIRAEKIAELKRKIAAGKYNIDENAIADRMVNEHVATRDLG